MVKRQAKRRAKPSPQKARADIIWDLASHNDLLRDGELELDQVAKVSEGDDNGAYIQTWMWVPYEDTEFDRGEPPGPKDWSPIRKPVPTPKAIWKLARENSLLRDGELELDPDAKVTEGASNGAYIQTWMWVPFEGTPLDKETEGD